MKKFLTLLTAVLILLAASGCGSAAPAGSAAVSAAASASVSASQQQPAIELPVLLGDILNAAPGTAGSSLKQARAAGELLDWAQGGGIADADEVKQWLDQNADSRATELAEAYAAVLDFGDMLVSGTGDTAGALDDAGYTLRYPGYDAELYRAAARSLSELFTRALEQAKTTPYAPEASTPYDAITLDKFEGVWCDGAQGELLIFSDGKCRVVIPYLDEYGDTAYTARIRDRSTLGYCPALEIDIHGSGKFEGPLAYYVSGVDDTHFWSGSQSQRFDRLEA